MKYSIPYFKKKLAISNLYYRIFLVYLNNTHLLLFEAVKCEHYLFAMLSNVAYLLAYIT